MKVTMQHITATQITEARASAETAPQVAKRLGVALPFIRNMIFSDWLYGMLISKAEWRTMRMCDIQARTDAWRELFATDPDAARAQLG